MSHWQLSLKSHKANRKGATLGACYSEDGHPGGKPTSDPKSLVWMIRKRIQSSGSGLGPLSQGTCWSGTTVGASDRPEESPCGVPGTTGVAGRAGSCRGDGTPLNPQSATRGALGPLGGCVGDNIGSGLCVWWEGCLVGCELASRSTTG